MGPLNINLNTSQAKTSIPQFVENTYVKVRLEKIHASTVEGKGSILTMPFGVGNCINFDYTLVEPVPDQDGGTIKPGDFGSKIFDRVRLYDKNTPEDQITTRAPAEIGKRQDAFLGTGDKGNKQSKPERGEFVDVFPNMIGQVAFIKLRNNKDPQYSNQEITEFKFVGDVAGA